MSERTLRFRLRSADKRKEVYESRKDAKEIAQNILNTAAEEISEKEWLHSVQSNQKRVVFSTKVYSNDDQNGGVPQSGIGRGPSGGILKSSPTPGVGEVPSGIAIHPLILDNRTPVLRKKSSKTNTSKRASSKATSTSRSASPSSSPILSAVNALFISPEARRREGEAKTRARDDAEVRRSVEFYQSQDEWWSVLPKTDYTYSKFSPNHKEIAPGVMTAPNMSRPPIHSSFTAEINRNECFPRRSFYESFHSDSESEGLLHVPTHSRYPGINTTHTSSWRILFLWTALSTMLTSTFDGVRHRLFGNRNRKAQLLSTPPRHTYRREPQGMGAVLMLPFRWMLERLYWLVTKTSLWDTWLLSSVRSSWSSDQVSRHGRRPHQSLCGLLLALFLLSSLLFALWSSDLITTPHRAMEPLIQTVAYVASLPVAALQLAFDWLWHIVSSPVTFVVWLWESTVSTLTASLALFPSLEHLSSLAAAVIKAPVYFFSFLWETFISVSGILFPLAPFATQKVYPESHTVQDIPTVDKVGAVENEAMEAMVAAAVRDRMQNVWKEMEHVMSKREQTLREELTNQLSLKLLSLQEGFRRMWRRVGTCCKRPPPALVNHLHSQVKEEVLHALSSPEALILLGAAAAHQENKNIPQIDESKIRAWVQAAFLERNDFERALANLTQHFYEELDRRNSMMMSATSDEINARIQQHQWSRMAELRAALSDAQRHENDFQQSGPGYGTAETASALDESRVRRIVQSALDLYDADKTGMADFALESQGGQVISTRCTETYQVKSPTLSVFGVPLWFPSNSPRTVIQPGMHPGECWAFVGSQGFLVIQLSHRIRVKGFTYEHISPLLLPTGKIDSAPKQFSVYGLRTEGDNDPFLLGTYHYLGNSTTMQFFAVQEANAEPVQFIEMQVTSNHGNINYTCLYRFRVHGVIV